MKMKLTLVMDFPAHIWSDLAQFAVAGLLRTELHPARQLKSFVAGEMWERI